MTQRFFWCLDHRRVEADDDRCGSDDVLGPYASSADAARALERVAERNEAWEEEEKRRRDEEDG